MWFEAPTVTTGVWTTSASVAARVVLTDAEAVQLAEMGMRVEAHYGVPQDTEWAFEGDTLFLVQTRPITTLGTEAPFAPPSDADAAGSALLRDCRHRRAWSQAACGCCTRPAKASSSKRVRSSSPR